jgi:hypothetical protein
MKFSDHAFKNHKDTIRISIQRTEIGWDYYVFYKHSKNFKSQGWDVGEVWKTLRDAKEDAEYNFGKMYPLRLSNLSDGWE